MQLDLKKLPFGQHLSRHLLFTEWDPLEKGYEKGLYLALATESSSMFGGVVSRSAGMIRLTPTLEGAAQDYTVEATPAQAFIRCGEKSIRLAIDGQALLLESNGLGLDLKVRLGHGETASIYETGYVMNMGATRYIVQMKQGRADMEVMWDLVGLHSTDPVIRLTPENGVLEAVFWDTDSAYTMPEIAPGVAAAAEKAQAAFDGFRARLTGKDQLYAYVLWLGFQKCRGQALLIANKMSDVRALARSQFLAALALKDAEPVIDLVCATLSLMTPGGLVPAWVKDSAILPEAAPPLWGLALVRAFARSGLDTVPREKVEQCYALTRQATEWWFRNRSVDDACFYAYAYESGWAHKPLQSDASPMIFPDLCGWMALNCMAVTALAQALELDEEAACWQKKADRQLQVLRSLWNGQEYVCRNAITGAEAPCTAALGLLTLSLGLSLPQEIGEVLRRRAMFPSFSPLITGLIAMGNPALAHLQLDRGVEKQRAAAAANFDPAVCALLLALEERS